MSPLARCLCLSLYLSLNVLFLLPSCVLRHSHLLEALCRNVCARIPSEKVMRMIVNFKIKEKSVFPAAAAAADGICLSLFILIRFDLISLID